MSGISVRPAPQAMGRPFHLQKGEYGKNSIEKALSQGFLTYADAQYIKGFITELKANNGISSGRANKIIFTLVQWRNYIGPFEENTIQDIYTGIESLKTGRGRSEPYKQNTVRDFLGFLKRFYAWLIEKGYSSLPIAKITAIKVVRRNTMTKTAEQILTEAEIKAIIEHARIHETGHYMQLSMRGVSGYKNWGN